jgi:5'-nucleotidase
VVLAHAGGDCKRVDDPNDISSCAQDEEAFKLARALPPGLVDAIVAGHTHAAVAHFVNGIAMVEAYSRGKAFGRLDLRFSGTPPRLLEVRPFAPEPLCPQTAELAPCTTHDYAGRSVQASEKIARLIAPAMQIARAERERSLGVEVVGSFEPFHGKECPLGNLFTDAMRALVPGADVAIANGGSLRAKLPEGPLSYGSLYESMPFDNRLVKLTLTGKELSKVLSVHLGHDAHGQVSISGLSARAECRSGALEVKLTRANGKPVRPDERLVVVTSDFLAAGGDRLFAPIDLTHDRVQPVDDLLLRDALATELAKRKRLDAESPDLYNPNQPRLRLPSPRPIECAARTE